MSWPPAPRVSPALAAAAGALRVVAVVQVVVGLAALLVAAYFVIGDLSDHSDEWDGLAALIGALVGGVAVVLVGVGALVLRLLRRNPVAAGAIVTALGGSCCSRVSTRALPSVSAAPTCGSCWSALRLRCPVSR